jgi:hypothetical protein
MRYEKTTTGHLRVFDSVEDMIAGCRTAVYRRHVESAAMKNERWVGRAFANWNEVYAAACGPWDEGRDTIERMVGQMEGEDLPKPVSRKRKTRFAQDDGSELDYDRLRSGQEFWRRCERQSTKGPQTVTIVADVSTRSGVNHEDILWRGAAAIAVTHVLEEAGYRVELWAVRCANQYDADGKDTVTAVNLKRAGDPLDIATLVTAVSGWFFRSMFFRAESLHAAEPRSTLGMPRKPTQQELVEITGTSDAVLVADVYDEQIAVWKAKQIIKRLAGIEDPPPPPVDTEPVVSDEPAPDPVHVEPPKPKTKAEIRAERAAQRQADRDWKRWLKQREKENRTGA